MHFRMATTWAPLLLAQQTGAVILRRRGTQPRDQWVIARIYGPWEAQIATDMCIIFDKPTSPSVISVGASNPDNCGSTYLRLAGAPYGPSASIQYQIVGADGKVSGAASLFEPQESIAGGAYGDVGCSTTGGNSCPSGWLWTPPSSKYATSSGTFSDVPLAFCASGPFNNLHPSGQSIGILIGNNRYLVRTQSFTTSSASAGHGSFTNSISFPAGSSADINYNQ